MQAALVLLKLPGRLTKLDCVADAENKSAPRDAMSQTQAQSPEWSLAIQKKMDREKQLLNQPFGQALRQLRDEAVSFYSEGGKSVAG